MRARKTHVLTTLRTAEDNMNVQMENINVTQRDGRVTHLDRVYIRGSHVRLFIVPDMLRYEEKFCENELRTTADSFAPGTRPCSDLATLVVAVLVSPEVAPLSTALVASAALLPDKRKQHAREHGITKIFPGSTCD